MAQTDYYGTMRRRSLLWPLVMLLIAFALGIGVTALALRNWDGLAKLLHPVPAAQPVVSSRPQPVMRPAQSLPQALPPASDPALNERVAMIESRIDEIDARASAASGDADRAEGLLLAFAARRALDRGQALGYIEGLLRDRFGGTDAVSVAQVIAAAQRPITLPQLRDGLATLRPALATRGPEQSWWQGFKGEMGSLFVVRHADQPSTIPADRLARAEHALEAGQVDAAAAEVARLPGAAGANAWLARARRYVLARNALDRIETAALLTPAARAAPPAPLLN